MATQPIAVPLNCKCPIINETSTNGQIGEYVYVRSASAAGGAAGVEGALELAGVAVVFGEGGGELVGAVHGGAGAEIEVAVAVRVQDGFKTGFVRHADRAGRKALMKVGVVRRIELQMLEQNPVQSVAVAESHGRVGLETHSKMQTVQVNAGDGGILRSIVRLAPHYGGHDRDLFRGQALNLGLSDILRRPERIVSAFLLVKNVLMEAVQ